MPGLEIVYESAKPRGPKVVLISYVKISTGFAEARQSRKAMQCRYLDDGEEPEEASPPSSPTGAWGSQRCGAHGKRPRSCRVPLAASQRPYGQLILSKTPLFPISPGLACSRLIFGTDVCPYRLWLMASGARRL